MKLKDIVGLKMLDAVEFSTVRVRLYSDEFYDCNSIRFRLDGKVYEAIEDPSDGYRSHMRDIRVSRKKINNTFRAVKVMCIHREKLSYGECDVLEIIDTVTGKTIIQVGTDNSDDYYPSFVSNFSPESMVINKGR